MSALTYNRACAEKVFQEVGGTEWSSLDAFRACAEENEDALLKAEVLSQRGDAETGEVGPPPSRSFRAMRDDGLCRVFSALLDLKAVDQWMVQAGGPACLSTTFAVEQIFQGLVPLLIVQGDLGRPLLLQPGKAPPASREQEWPLLPSANLRADAS